MNWESNGYKAPWQTVPDVRQRCLSAVPHAELASGPVPRWIPGECQTSENCLATEIYQLGSMEVW